MEIKIKKSRDNAVIPYYASDGAIAMDLTCAAIDFDEKNLVFECKTGINVEIPEGCAGFILPRSSIYKTVLDLSNAVGVIDPDYRGEIMFKFRDIYITGDSIQRRFRKFNEYYYTVGDRIGQLVILPVPRITWKIVDELSSTERGDKGFGSTGK